MTHTRLAATTATAVAAAAVMGVAILMLADHRRRRGLRAFAGSVSAAAAGSLARANVTATDLGISRWHVSISHIETHATASAIGLRGETDQRSSDCT